MPSNTPFSAIIYGLSCASLTFRRLPVPERKSCDKIDTATLEQIAKSTGKAVEEITPEDLPTKTFNDAATKVANETGLALLRITNEPLASPAPLPALANRGIPASAPAPRANFSAFYPTDAIPNQRYGLYIYAHTSEQLATIQADAAKFKDELGGEVNTPRTARQSAALEIGTPITVIPECNGLEFDPPTLTRKWHGDWTRFGFEFRPTPNAIGDILFIRVSVQVSGIEIAHIKCAVEVNAAPDVPVVVAVPEVSNPLAAAKYRSRSATLYQRIFISYSRKDSRIAHAYKLAQQAAGNEVFIDVDGLRAGEDWRAGLAQAIDQADILQLFWSEHSAASDYCRYEWEYALGYRCPDAQCAGFIRPVYWQKPMPKVPTELGHLNFKYVPLDAAPNEPPAP
jgi:hypothetical protein